VTLNFKGGGPMYKYTVYEILPTQPFFKKVDEVKAMNSESARRKAIIGTNTEYSNTCTMQEKKSRPNF
tara:strand:- start:944 stop:1147 length:204 start_codon:yes stop_codon:yes gene_type:complete